MLCRLGHYWPYLFAAYLYCAATTPADGQWCKVRCSDGSVGSGALVDAYDGKGLAITAHHVVRDVMRGQQQNGKVRCDFGGPIQYEARIVSIDEAHDLCALLIAEPSECRPVRLAGYTGQGTHTVYGFPGGGQLRPVSGRVIDDTSYQFAPGDYNIALLSQPTQGGQSGGAVATEQGMVGVMWGSDGRAHMTCGKPFDDFLIALTQGYSCYGGQCWRPSQTFRPGGRVIISGPSKPIDSTPPANPQQTTVNTKDLKAEILAELKVEIAKGACKCEDCASGEQLLMLAEKLKELTALCSEHAKASGKQADTIIALAQRVNLNTEAIAGLDVKVDQRFVTIENKLNQQPAPPAEQAEPQIVSYDIVPRKK